MSICHFIPYIFFINLNFPNTILYVSDFFNSELDMASNSVKYCNNAFERVKLACLLFLLFKI